MLAERPRHGHQMPMGLKDYLLGRRFQLHSLLPANEVESRIREAAGSLFNPFGDGVSGWCRFGHLRLHVATPMFSNGFQPIFAGRVSGDLGATEVNARFGASLYLRIFFLFWYGVLLIIAFTLVPVILRGPLETGYEPLGILMVLLFMAAPLLFHKIFNRGADDELEKILQFLQEEADLTIQAGHSSL